MKVNFIAFPSFIDTSGFTHIQTRCLNKVFQGQTLKTQKVAVYLFLLFHYSTDLYHATL